VLCEFKVSVEELTKCEVRVQLQYSLLLTYYLVSKGQVQAV